MTISLLPALGWDDDFEKQLLDLKKKDGVVGRISEQHKTHFCALTEKGECRVHIPGRMRFGEEGEISVAVGDWIYARELSHDEIILERVLDRRSKLSRNVAGKSAGEQIFAANMDFVFVVESLGQELNLRRVERFLFVARTSGAEPVLLLTKCDLCPDTEEILEKLKRGNIFVKTFFLNALQGQGVSDIAALLKEHKTAVVLGPSGVGKSTLINSLLQRENFVTGDVRESDHKGRHTTTHRELVLLPTGGAIIDTPGIRELQVWEEDEDSANEMFAEIKILEKQCRFRDCQHKTEPGCMVLAAIDRGELDQNRVRNFEKLQREVAYQERRTDKKAQRDEKQKWKRIAQQQRKRKKFEEF